MAVTQLSSQASADVEPSTSALEGLTAVHPSTDEIGSQPRQTSLSETHHHKPNVHHQSGQTVAPTPDTATDDKVNLDDQTNFLPKKQVLFIFTGLSAALMIALLDTTIVSTALPTITKAFSAGQDAAWLSTSYLLTSTAAVPLYGRFSDIFGRKVCLIFALVVFLIFSALCAAAQSMTQLIVFRSLAGIGGGGIITLCMVIISDIVPMRERGKYQGFFGVIVALSNSAGPLLGGALAKAGWRWCFIIAVPILVIALVSVAFLLPLKKVQGDIKTKLKIIDYFGTFLICASTILLLLGLNWGGQQYPWGSVHVLVPIILGAAILVFFVIVEIKFAALPIVPMRLFKIATVASIMAQTVASGAIFYILLFFIPQFTQVIKGYSEVKAGVTLIPLMALQAITSTVSGLLVSKYGKYKLLIVLGFAIFSIGIGLLTTLTEHSSIGAIIGFLLLSGFGAGQTLQTTLVAVQNAVGRKDLAVVTSTRNFARLFGGTLGLAFSYTILNNTVQHKANTVDSHIVRQIVKDPTSIRSSQFSPQVKQILLDAYVDGFRNVFYFGLALILFAFVVTLLFVQENSLDRNDDQKHKEEAKQWVERQKQQKRQKNGIKDEEKAQS